MNAMPKGFLPKPRAEYMELAEEERVNDVGVAESWVWDQLNNNRASFVRSLAEAIASGSAPGTPHEVLDEQFCDWVRAHPATKARADELREDAEEAEREAEENARYARECEDSIPNIPCW